MEADILFAQNGKLSFLDLCVNRIPKNENNPSMKPYDQTIAELRDEVARLTQLLADNSSPLPTDDADSPDDLLLGNDILPPTP